MSALYLAKWSSGQGKYLEWEDIQEVSHAFFNDGNGYTAEDRKRIDRLPVGDRLDLSDGISQYHEIERIV